MDIETKELGSRPVVGIRRGVKRSEIKDFIPEVFGKVGPFMESAGMEMTGPPVAIYYGGDGDVVEMSAGAPVRAVTATTGEFVELELPGGPAATAVYSGDPEGLPQAWEGFMSEIESRGLAAGSPCWEECLTDPDTEPDSSKWQTLMVMPLTE